MTATLARRIPGLAAAAIVLVPLATLALPFRSSLVARAGLVALVTAALAATAMVSTGWVDRLRSTPRPLLLGTAAWAAAGLLGGVVGLASGNRPLTVAGQVLAMVLLPAAALAGFALPGPGLRSSFQRGAVLGVGIGAVAQLGWAAWSLFAGTVDHRLYLPNAVSVVGAAPLALLLAIPLAVSTRRSDRILALAATSVVATVILGAAVRALWLLVPVALALLVVLWRGGVPRVSRLAVAGVLAPVAVVVLVHLAIELGLAAERPNLLAGDLQALLGGRADRTAAGAAAVEVEVGDGARDPAAVPTVEVESPGTYQLRVEADGVGDGQVRLAVRWLDATGRPLGGTGVSLPLAAGPLTRRAFGAAPDATRRAAVSLEPVPGSRGRLRVSDLRLERVGGRHLAPLLAWRAALAARGASLVALLTGGSTTADPAISFRVTESSRVLASLARFTPLEWLVGRGLGATVHLGVSGFDSQGHRVWYSDVNYLHNFYLLLPFKLGLVGTALALAALAAWVAWPLRTTLASGVPAERAFPAAVTAAWFLYAAWGLTSPELVDFSLAPLFGLLVAASGDR